MLDGGGLSLFFFLNMQHDLSSSEARFFFFFMNEQFRQGICTASAFIIDMF